MALGVETPTIVRVQYGPPSRGGEVGDGVGDEDEQTRPVSPPTAPQGDAHAAPSGRSSRGGMVSGMSRAGGHASSPRVTAPLLRGEAALLAGGVLDGRYRLVRKLGQGGMGSVYLVDDLLLRRRVAMKTLRINGGSHRLDQQEELERFRKEAATTHAINHQNVARTYDIGEEDGVHYMTMEWLDGDTMMDRLRAKGALSPAEVRALATPIAKGLRAAHRAGIVHRDLKPANIMLVGPERGAVLMDFGIAASVTEASQATGGSGGSDDIGSPWEVTSAGRGTPAYMAPEQWDEHQGDARTDIYAFGVILYVALTGKGPFSGRTTAELANHHRQTRAPDVRAIVPTVDRDLAELIQRCLAKRTDQRPADMDEVLDVLHRRQRRMGWLRNVASTAALTVLATLVIDIALFAIVRDAVLAELRPSLMRLAQLVALDLPTDDLAVLRRADDAKTPAFLRVHTILSRAIAESPEIKALYVLRQDSAPSQYRFVADARPNDEDIDGDGVIDASERGVEVGVAYDGSAYPAMSRTLATGRPQSDDAFGEDDWGLSLSGYAPIVVGGNKPTMFVGVDVGSTVLETLRRRLRVVLGTTAGLLVLAAAALTRPLPGGATHWSRLMERGNRDETTPA